MLGSLAQNLDYGYDLEILSVCDCYHLGQQLCILSSINHKWTRLYSSEKQNHPNITLIHLSKCEAQLIYLESSGR